MYGRDEHLAALNKVAVITRELDNASALIDYLVKDLADDDLAATLRARSYLLTAQQRIASALGQCDLAVQYLPTPVAR